MSSSRNTPQRIAIITDAWHPQVNGVVTVYDRTIPRLERHGYDVSVIHPGLFKAIALPGYPEIRLALFPKRKLDTMLTDLKPDAIHVAVEGPLGFAARSICKKRGIPFTTCYHSHFAMYLGARGLGFLSPLTYALLRKFHNSGTRTMVATESLRHELERHGFTNLVLWPLGVDVDLFKRNANPKVPKLPKPVFTYMGRIAVEKNLDEFLSADLPGTKLIIGDGPDKKHLEKKYSSARFVGYKKGQGLIDWLSLSDVFVFPSRTDTFGLVIIEALACGIPVAAHDCMGPRDIITNGVDGYLSEDLTDAAKKCLALSKDDCRKKALQYAWENSAGTFLSNLTQV